VGAHRAVANRKNSMRWDPLGRKKEKKQN